jgi:hypothetical protein
MFAFLLIIAAVFIGLFALMIRSGVRRDRRSDASGGAYSTGDASGSGWADSSHSDSGSCSADSGSGGDCGGSDGGGGGD